MKVEEAKYEGGWLKLRTDSPKAKRFVYGFKKGVYELKRSYEKRSLDANAYCWVLCTKIADAVGIKKEEVYQRAIQEGSQFCMSVVADEDYDSFVRAWTSKGLGWRVQVVDDFNGQKTVFAYYGSSAYDSHAMHQLLENLLEEARCLGLEVRPEEEVKSMLEEWS